MLTWMFSVSLAGAPTHHDIDAATWRDVARAKHDDVGTIQISHAELGPVDCYRGVAQVADTSIDALIDTVSEISNAPRWSSAGIVEGAILSRRGDHLEYYQVLDVPDWTLASDRYWFLQGDITRTPSGAAAFRWERLPEDQHRAVRERVTSTYRGAIEPPVNVGVWSFAPAGDEVEVTYIICSDTGGSMPRMIQNTATRTTMPATIADLVREARRVAK